MAGGRVRVRRVYEEPEPGDGTRVLVDRIWPRGLAKAKAALDEWCKSVAASDELRKWYSHDPDRFEEFRPPLPAGAARSPAGGSTGAPARTCEGSAVDAAHRDQATRDQRSGRARRPAPQLSRPTRSAPPRCRLPDWRPRRVVPKQTRPASAVPGWSHPPPPTTPWSASSRAAPLSSGRSPVGVRKRRPVCGDSTSTISSRIGNSTPSSSSCSVLGNLAVPAIGRSWCRSVRTMSARVCAAVGRFGARDAVPLAVAGHLRPIR